MNSTATLFTLLGIFLTGALTIWAVLRGEGTRREEADKRQIKQVEQLLQNMVVDKIEAAFLEIAKLQKQVGTMERAHSHLLGFLEGKGCTLPECPDNTLQEVGS